MRVRTDIDQKLLSELYYQYLNVEEDFIKDLFSVAKQNWGEFLSKSQFLLMKIPSISWTMNELVI